MKRFSFFLVFIFLTYIAKGLTGLKLTNTTVDFIEYEGQVLGRILYYKFAVFRLYFDSEIYFLREDLQTTSSFTPLITSAQPNLADSKYHAAAQRRLLEIEQTKYGMQDDHAASDANLNQFDSRQLDEGTSTPSLSVPGDTGVVSPAQNGNGILEKAFRAHHSIKSSLSSMVKRIAAAIYQAGAAGWQISQKVVTRSYADGQMQDYSEFSGLNVTMSNLTGNSSNATNQSTSTNTTLRTSALYTETFAAFMTSAAPEFSTSQQSSSSAIQPSTTITVEGQSNSAVYTTSVHTPIHFSSTPNLTPAITGQPTGNTTANLSFYVTSAIFGSSIASTAMPTSNVSGFLGELRSSKGGEMTVTETTASASSSLITPKPTDLFTNGSNKILESTAPFLSITSTIPAISSTVLSSMPGSTFPHSSSMYTSSRLFLSSSPQRIVATSRPSPQTSTRRKGSTVPLANFNRTGPGQTPAILDLKSMGTIQLALRCGGNVLGLDAVVQNPRLVTTRPVSNPLIDAFKPLTGYEVPMYMQSNQDQRWVPGLFTMVYLVSHSEVKDTEADGFGRSSGNEQWPCGSDNALNLGQVEINSPNSSGLYQLSDESGNSAWSQTLDLKMAQNQCTYGDLMDTSRIFEASQRDVYLAVGKEQFDRAIFFLNIVTASTGFVGCKKAVGRRVKLVEQSSVMSGFRTCSYPFNSSEWLQSACCNPSLLFQQCCVPSDVDVNLQLVNSLRGLDASSCSGAWQRVIQKRLLSYAEVTNFREDSFSGCKSVRRNQASEEIYDRYMSIVSICHDILDGGLTKSRFRSCKSNSDCYTECQDSTCNPSSPSEYGSYFLSCILDQIDPLVLNYLKANLGLGPSTPLISVMSSFMDKYGLCSCIGSSALPMDVRYMYKNTTNSYQELLILGDNETSCQSGLVCNDGMHSCEASSTPFFCADCSQNNKLGGDCGNQTDSVCKSISIPAMCFATGVSNPINCTLKQGTFVATSPGYDGSLCMFKVNVTDTNGSSCYSSTLCRNNRQLCNQYDICYISPSNESDCMSLRGNGSWPLWISESTSADLDAFLFQLKSVYRGSGICLFGIKDMSVDSGGNQAGQYEQRECSTISRSIFSAARTFVPAKWFDRTSCQRGVCSAAPSDYEASLGTVCATSRGICSGPCPRCESSLGYSNSEIYRATLDSVCIWPRESNESLCSALNGIWDHERSICYYFPPVNQQNSSICTPGFSIYSCTNLSISECQRSDELISTDNLELRIAAFISNYLDCFWNTVALCSDKNSCEKSGWCDDWAYQTGGEPVCRIPWEPGKNGEMINTNACEFNEKSLDVHMVLGDACLVSPLSDEECTSLNGTSVYQAVSKDECESREACFFNTFQITNLTRSECSSFCDPSLYQWRSLYTWHTSVWTRGSIIPRQWKRRTVVPQNRWAKIAVVGRVIIALEGAVLSTLADPYISQALCSVSPEISIFTSIACACDHSTLVDSTQRLCNYSLGSYLSPKILQGRSFAQSERVFRSAAGTILVVNQDSPRKIDTSVLIQVQFIPMTELMQSFSFASSSESSSCAAFEVVTKLNLSTGEKFLVGQVMGPALILSGLNRGRAYFCLDSSQNVYKCLDKYSVFDFGMFQGSAVVASYTAVSKDLRTGSLCGWINTSSVSSTIAAIPILRQNELQPSTLYQGPSVQISTSLALKNKALFNDARRSAFRSAMAESIGSRLSISDINILQVCDIFGCSFRRSGSPTDMTTVNTQIKAQVLSADQILSKVTDSTFASILGKNLNVQLASLGLGPLDIQVLSVTVNYPPISSSAAPNQSLTSAALLPNRTWLTTVLSAVGNLSRSIEIANEPFQAVEISSDQFSQIWAIAFPLIKAGSVAGIAFFAAPGAILFTVPGAVYSPAFALEVKTLQLLSSGVAFAGVSFGNITEQAPTIRLLQFPLRGQRRGICPSTDTDWRTSLTNATPDFACNCPGAMGCGGAGVTCEVIPVSGDVWLPSATGVSLCSSSDQHLSLGLGLGFGLLLPIAVLVGLLARLVLLCRRLPPEQRRRKAEEANSVRASHDTNRDAPIHDGNGLSAGNATRPTRTHSPELSSTPRSHASQEQPR